MHLTHLAARAVHILAGSLAVVLGFVALYAAKGAWLHRRTGRLFVYAMLTMSTVGATMAAIWGRQPASNIPMGLLTAYLVVTALTTIRPPHAGSRGLERGLMLMVLALGLVLWSFAVVASSRPHGNLAGVPAAAFFIFGSIALLAGVGDMRMIRAGGVHALRGAPRITRHLWRMCLALLIASLSLGQFKMIPRSIRGVPVLMIPPLLVAAALVYWVWRVRVRRSVRGLAATSAPEAMPVVGALGAGEE